MIDFEAQKESAYNMIECQLIIIASMSELPDDLYDEMQEDKIRVIANAMLIIQAVQKSMLVFKKK